MLRPADRRDRDGAPRQLPLDHFRAHASARPADVAVAGAITVGDDALRRCLNRAVMGHRLVGLQGQLRGGIANFVSLPI